MHVDRRSVLETILICRPFLLRNRRDALFSVANGREVRSKEAARLLALSPCFAFFGRRAGLFGTNL
jgi:hypothetical protein